MECIPDDLLLRIFTAKLVELGALWLPVVAADEDHLGHSRVLGARAEGWCSASPWDLTGEPPSQRDF